LGQGEVVLHGTDRTRLTIPFADLASVEIGRGTSDRINGDKSLVLERHFCERVFVSGREVVFFFEGDSAATVVEALSRNPGVLKAAARWRGILAGRPRLAE